MHRTLQPADTRKTTLLFLLMLRICQMSAHSHASVTVTSPSSQYFEYDDISVSCENFTSGEWTVWRKTNTSVKKEKVTLCKLGGANQTSIVCTISSAKKQQSGEYWCESKEGNRSNTINITVTDKSVILQSPVLPVMEGDDVTLRCQTKDRPFDLTADFYKHSSKIRTEPTGHMTIRRVSRSHEGFYKCHMSHGESPSSWISVTATTAGSPTTPSDPAPSSSSPQNPSASTIPPLVMWSAVSCFIILLVLVILLVLLVLLVRQRNHRKPEAAGDENITDDVTNSNVTRQQQMRQSRESDPSVVYAAVRPTENVTYGQVVKNKKPKRKTESGPAAKKPAEEVTYGQIVIRPNRRREPPPEPEVVYSSPR